MSDRAREFGCILFTCRQVVGLKEGMGLAGVVGKRGLGDVVYKATQLEANKKGSTI